MANALSFVYSNLHFDSCCADFNFSMEGAQAGILNEITAFMQAGCIMSFKPLSLKDQEVRGILVVKTSFITVITPDYLTIVDSPDL